MFLDAAGDWIFGAAFDSSPKVRHYWLIFNTRKFRPPYGGLLSSSCGGLEPFGPAGPTVTLSDGRTESVQQTDGRKTGLRELDMIAQTVVVMVRAGHPTELISRV